MILTTLTVLILWHALQRKSEKCTKNRGARAEPSLMNPLCWTCFGSLIARESFNMHKPVCTATSSTLYPENSFIQIARYPRSSLDDRGTFDSGLWLQVHLLYWISPMLPFGIVSYVLTLLLDNLSRNSCICWKLHELRQEGARFAHVVRVKKQKNGMKEILRVRSWKRRARIFRRTERLPATASKRDFLVQSALFGWFRGLLFAKY